MPLDTPTATEAPTAAEVPISAYPAFFRAFPDRDSIDGGNWPLDAVVHLAIDDPATELSPDHEQDSTVILSPWDPSSTYVSFDFANVFDLKEGDMVTLTAGVISRQQVVPHLAVTNVDLAADTVAGSAVPGIYVHVFIGASETFVPSDATGEWLADFSGLFDIVPGTSGGAEVLDQDGDSTIIDWSTPPPPPNAFFRTFPNRDSIDGGNWPLDAVVHLTIDDPATSSSPDHEQDATVIVSPWDPNSTYVSFDFANVFDLKEGDVATLTAGVISRQQVVPHLSVTDVDLAADTVAGSAGAGVNVHVFIGPSQLFVTTGANGAWLADFSGLFDLVPGTAGGAEVWDEDGDSTIVDWSVPIPPNPHFTAFPEWEFVEGSEWPLEAVVHLSIDDPATAAVPDYQQDETVGPAPWDPNSAYVSFEFAGTYDMKPGDVVTLTDGVTERVHVVRNLSVTTISVDADTVAGTADAGEVVNVWPHETGQQEAVTADADGMWQVDLTGAYDIVPGSAGRAEIRDEAGNATAVDWQVPNPWFTAFPEWEFIEGFEWPMGAVVHLAIDDPATEASPDLERDDIAEPSPWGDPRSYVSFDLVGAYDVKPDDLVTLSDGATVRTHVVRNLSITTVDEVDDTVAGTADAGAVVNVWPHETGEQVAVTADADGMWQVDLTGAYDIVPGSAGRAEIRDDFYNGTAVDWSVPPSPRFTAFPEWEFVEGWDWPLDALVHLTIDDPATPATPDYEQNETVGYAPWDPNTIYVSFEFGGLYDMKPGDVVTLTDGVTERVHVVRNLSVTTISVDADTVAGMADEGEVVNVWPHETGQQVAVTADANGMWQVDFIGMFDVVPGTGGRAEIRDDTGNATDVDWYLPNPRFNVFPEWEFVEGWDWRDGVPVTTSVDGKPECSATGTSSGGYFNMGLPQGCDVEAGDVVTLTDEVTTRTHIIRNLSITSVDPLADTVTGAADPGEVVNVWPHETGQQVAVTADASGVWHVDFSGAYDIVPGSAGQAEIRDDFDNGTAVGWYVPNPRFTVFPEWEFVDAYDWPDGVPVTAGVDGKPECTAIGTSSGGFFNLGFPQGCDVEAGNVVTLTDEVTTRTHIIRNLSITSVDPVADTVAGAADPGEVVNVGPHETGQVVAVTADADGMWQVDFTGAYDIVLGSGGRSEIRDEVGNSTAVDWYVPNPHFTVFPEWEFVDAYDWPDGVPVTAGVDGKPECTAIGTSSGGFFNLGFPQGCDVEAGNVVTLTDEVTTRTHIIRNLSITSVDPVADTVVGAADPGEVVNVWPHETGQQVAVTAGADGMWQVDFTGAYDIVPGSGGRSEIRDEVGNSTAVDWYVPNPRFVIFPEWEFVDAYDWPDGVPVTASVEGKPECSATGTSSGGFFNMGFPDGCDVEIGNVVTLTDQVTTRTHIVRNLSITSADPLTDTVAGAADPGELVNVWPHETGEQVAVTADASGAWQVDFTGAYDIVPGSAGRAEIRDEVGNGTAVDWYVPNPWITALPEWEIVEGWEWPMGAVVHLSVDDPATGISPDLEGDDTSAPTPWGDPRSYVSFDLGGAYDLKAGDVVTLTDVVSERIHVVRNLSVTIIDTHADTVGGTADPGEVVKVWLHGTEEQVAVTAADDGGWLADFTGLVDLVVGTGGRAQIRDEAGNDTQVDWQASPPGAVPSPSFVGHWRAIDIDGSIIRLTIAGAPDGPFRITWTEDYLGGCNGGPGIVRGEGSLREDTANALEADLEFECFNGDTSVEFHVLWVYHSEMDVLSSQDDSGVVTIWTRPGEELLPALQPRIVASSTGNWFWTSGFFPQALLTIQILDWPQPDAALLWEGARQADESGFVFVDSEDHSLDLLPGYHLMISDGFGTKTLLLELITMDVFDLALDLISGTAPAGRLVLVVAADSPEPADQTTIEVNADPDTGAWSADFGATGVDITEEMRPWSFAQIFDGDGDANEANPPALPPDIGLRVNYGDDWVESFYEAGHNVVVTVIGSDGVTVKATAAVFTQPREDWGGEPGFQTQPDDWSPAPPDIQANDWVFAQVDNGESAEVQLGEITGEIDLETDGIQGTILAPWLSSEVNVECHPWGSPAPVEAIKLDAALPDGIDTYSCSWDPATEWDIQAGQVVGVAYSGPEGHWVANTFFNLPQYYLRIESDPGDYVGQGGSEYYTGDTATFEAFNYYGNQVRLRVFPAAGGFWVLAFAAPAGAPLTPGLYEDALRFADENHAGLDIGGHGRGCNMVTGRFEVFDAEFALGGSTEVLAFRASFEQHCEGAAPALRGEIGFFADPPGAVPSASPEGRDTL